MKITNLAVACGLILGGWNAAQAAPTADVKMELMASGAMPKLGGYMPQQIRLSSTKPDGLKKSPESKTLLFGTIQFGGAPHIVALDEPEGADAKLYVDANGNGDLTDDPAPEWNKREYNSQGTKLRQYMGGFKLPLGKGEDAPLAHLGAYRFDKKDPQRATLAMSLFYYRDYAFDGEVTLGEQKYHAMLAENMASGDFSGKGQAAPRLMIDRNGDGRFVGPSESFDVTKPFNIEGNVWKVNGPSVDGKFKIEPSSEQVAEIKPPPNHSVGKMITAFKAKKMDGSEVNFPEDYKGKVVMLDFWATWCGPCMGEVPGLTKAYQEFHPKGIEILGISLDQPNAAAKVKEVTAAQKMTWPQVYDGKFWEAEIAQLYGIQSIPAAFLVDGDTGEILAAGESLRGPALEGTWKSALEKKKAK